MAPIIRSLDEITTGYSVFERNQVLTAPQLNSVAAYFEDQTRLTRTQLLGTGIVCGLRTNIQNRTIRLEKGMGVTTDGDLLFYSDDVLFDKFKVYDEKNSRYDAFFAENQMIPLYELIPRGIKDPRAIQLSKFNEETGIRLNEAIAVLYMESYLFDPDLCSGSDCDNLGKEFRNNRRLLLTSRQFLSMLKSSILTPHEVFSRFEEIVPDRPQFSAGIKTELQYVQQFRAACDALNGKFGQFQHLYSHCSFFIGDLFTSDPWPVWSEKFQTLESRYRRNPSGIQYYYDFMKDVAETFNEFLDLIFEDNSWCSPAVSAFPKHLLLGTLGAANDDDRCGLYPSPLTAHSREQREHARFLVRKLNMIIDAFNPPVTSSTDLRITPGKSELSRPEDRPIPYYYQIDRTHPLHQFWNYSLYKRNKGAWNYSYHAALYNARGGAANPFGNSISGFDFFRIEGHLGQNISRVHNFLESEMRRLNLPFNTRSVMLSENRGKLVIKPGFVFNDLHKLHNLMRHDLANQLDEVKNYSGGLKTLVKTNLNNQDLDLDPEDRTLFNVIADGMDSEVKSAVEQASTKLNGTYQQYMQLNTSNNTWRTPIGNAMQKSGDFKSKLSKAARTDFNTPFDSFISNRNFDLLDRLDELIQADTEKREKRLLFPNYFNDHPGMEHCAGVLRGGTFVVLYNEDGLVVGDVMIPYMEADVEKLDESEPAISIRPLRPGFVLDKGINLFKPFDKNIKSKLEIFKSGELESILTLRADTIRTTLDNTWNTRFNDQQKDYFQTIKESWGTMSNAFIKKINVGDLTGDFTNFNDLELGKSVNNMKAMRELMVNYKAKSETVTDPVEKQHFARMAETLEDELSNTLTEITRKVADSDQELSLGTDGFKAMMEVNNGLQLIKTDAVMTRTSTTIEQLAVGGKNSSLKLMVGNILKK